MTDKIQRQTQKIFCGKAPNNSLAAFGSMITGNPVYTDKIKDLQSSQYEEGWESAVAANEAPFMEEMNGVQYGFSKQLAYIFQEGVPEYDAETAYFKGSIIKALNTDNAPVLYYSLTDNNLGNNPTEDTTNWKKMEFGGGGSGFNLFDTKLSDHMLSGEEALGWALQGTYTISSYTAFYQKCLAEKNAATVTIKPLSWTQPVLTSNGTLGGDSFAVYTDVSVLDNQDIYKAFDNNTSTQFHSAQGIKTGSFIMYNPVPLKITNIAMTNQPTANRASSAGSVYGSDDNENWVLIETYTNSNQAGNATWNINLESNTNYYKYYKVQSTAGGSDNYWTIAEVKLTAFTGYNVYKHSNGHVFYDIADKSIFDDIYTETGVCWAYGIDTENERVFLPRNDWFDECASSNPGEFVEPGLPNITGSWIPGIRTSEANQISGVFKEISGTNITSWGSSNSGIPHGFTFDASRSSSVYGNSDTVQPPAVKKLLYFCVGNTIVNAAEVDVSELTSDVQTLENSKLNINADNLTALGKKNVTKLAMPSGNFIALTLGDSGSHYTAPADGWFTLAMAGSASQTSCKLTNTTNGICSGYTTGTNGSAAPRAFIPCAQGDDILVEYASTSTTNWFRFVYAKGSY